MSEPPVTPRPTRIDADAAACALEASGTGVWVSDADSGLVAWDTNMEALSGLGPGGFAGTYDAWVATLHPEDRDTVTATVASAMRSGHDYQFEHRVTWPDGTTHWLECRGRVTTDATGRATGTIGSVVDVTDRKEWDGHREQLLDQTHAAALRMARLQRSSQVLSGASTEADVIDVALDFAVGPPHSSTRMFWLRNQDDGRLELVGQRGLSPQTERRFSLVDPASGLPPAVALRDRVTVVAVTAEDAQALLPAEDPVGIGAGGFVTVPVVADDVALGVLAFGCDGSVDPSDVVATEAAAGLIGQTLSRVRLTEALVRQADQDRQLARTLQEAFLPPRLPVVDRLELAARYLPASLAADVGGDFYDVFLVDEGTWAMLIGDVCGTGADAAAVASIARHTARAAARHGHDPVTVVEWVNHAVLHSGRDLFATMLYATLTERPAMEGLEVTVISGGHPLPILVDDDGAGFVGSPGSLLGAFDAIKLDPRTFTVRPDDWFVVYTDGVTDLPPPHGLGEDDLLQLIERLVRSTADVDAVALGVEADLDARAPARERRDDVALLVGRVHRPGAGAD